MNRRHLIRVLAIASFTLLFGATRAPAAEPRKEKALHVGESLRYDSGLKLTFLAAHNDSRCPFNAQCLYSGDAEVVLWVKAGKQKAYKVRINTDPTRALVIPANVYPPATPPSISKYYVISIARLRPFPNTQKKLLQSDYRLKLDISASR